MSEFANENRKEDSNVLDTIQDFIMPSEVEIEGSGYQRGLIDRRYEKYLDKHFDEYIEEFGLVRELHLDIYEDRYEQLVEDTKDMKEFQKDIDAELSSLERRLDRLEEEI